MTPQHPPHSPSRTTSAPSLHQRGQSGRARHRALPLTDDQYVATSLALVAKLALHLRESAHRHG